MIVMPSNNGKFLVHYWQGKWGGLGHLYSVGGQRGPFEHLPYALDNGRFPAWSSGTEWDEDAYMRLLYWARDASIQPMWSLVPDVVTEPEATIDEWHKWLPKVKRFGFPLAFAMQDGHDVSDVPAEADVVFIGGSTDWKWEMVPTVCQFFPRVHVGRVNTYRHLMICHNAGAESCDGTGWFRGGRERSAGLERYLFEQGDKQ